MKYRKLSWVASLLAFFSMFAQLYAVTSAAGAKRSEPGEGKSGVFSAGVIFGDLCARGVNAALPVVGERSSRQ
jgi:hypothetical protein